MKNRNWIGLLWTVAATCFGQADAAKEAANDTIATQIEIKKAQMDKSVTAVTHIKVDEANQAMYDHADIFGWTRPAKEILLNFTTSDCTIYRCKHCKH